MFDHSYTSRWAVLWCGAGFKFCITRRSYGEDPCLSFLSFTSCPPAVPLKPACNQVYNLFHPFDPSASRIEPLIMSQFNQIPTVSVPRYHRFPLGDGQSHLLNNVIGAYPELFVAPPLTPVARSRPGMVKREESNLSTTSLMSSDSSGGTDLDIGTCHCPLISFAPLLFFSNFLSKEYVFHFLLIRFFRTWFLFISVIQ